MRAHGMCTLGLQSPAEVRLGVRSIPRGDDCGLDERLCLGQGGNNIPGWGKRVCKEGMEHVVQSDLSGRHGLLGGGSVG